MGIGACKGSDARARPEPRPTPSTAVRATSSSSGCSLSTSANRRSHSRGFSDRTLGFLTRADASESRPSRYWLRYDADAEASDLASLRTSSSRSWRARTPDQARPNASGTSALARPTSTCRRIGCAFRIYNGSAILAGRGAFRHGWEARVEIARRAGLQACRAADLKVRTTVRTASARIATEEVDRRCPLPQILSHGEDSCR